MSLAKLHLGFGDYDRTRPLADGTVKIEGAEPTFRKERVITEIFRAMVKDRAFDVAELGLSYFLRTVTPGHAPFLAIPVFPVRNFRLSSVYVNVKSGIKRPQDLNGKVIGELAMYGHDAGVWPKGILADEYGFEPERCRWVIGGLDWPLTPIDFVPQPHPAGTEVRIAPKGTDLGALLEAGEIDALVSADIPKCILERSPKVARLFPDYVKTEREYFERTKIFPIMHAVVVKRELAEESPALVRAVYDAFCKAKDLAAEQYVKGLTFNNMAMMLPWLTRLVEEDLAVFGKDWWPYGMAANRNTVETFLRYHAEQGLGRHGKKLTCEDVFVRELLDT